MDSKHKLVMILLAPLLLTTGCAHLPKKVSTGIESQSFTIRFVKYETTVEINGTPEEVGKYMLQPRNFMNYETKKAKWEATSPKMLEQVGDTIGYTITTDGIITPMIGILVDCKPGQEIWYFFTGTNGVLADLKLYLEPFQGHTKLKLKYEDEVSSSEAQDPKENQEMKERMAQIFEMIIAKVQQHFDPSLKPEELLKEGLRGKFSEPLYDAYQASIWIDSPPKKVYEYINGPGMKKYDAEYGSWMGKLFFSHDKGPAPAKINTDGINLDLIGFPALSTYGRSEGGYHSTGYLMPQSHSFVTKNQITIKAGNGGSELSINYLVSSSRVVSTELYDLALLETQLPEPIQRFLLGVKHDMEAGKK